MKIWTFLKFTGVSSCFHWTPVLTPEYFISLDLFLQYFYWCFRLQFCSRDVEFIHTILQYSSWRYRVYSKYNLDRYGIERDKVSIKYENYTNSMSSKYKTNRWNSMKIFVMCVKCFKMFPLKLQEYRCFWIWFKNVLI